MDFVPGFLLIFRGLSTCIFSVSESHRKVQGVSDAGFPRVLYSIFIFCKNGLFVTGLLP